MRAISLSLIAALSLVACSPAQDATTPPHGPDHNMATQGITLTNVMIRPPLPGRTTAMGTLHIKNNSAKDDVLLAVKADLPGETEIHTMLNEGGVMKMRRLENGLPIKAGQTAVLKGGADHLMIFNTQIAPDMKTTPLTLSFKYAGDIQTLAHIDDGSGQMDHSGH